MLDLMPDCVSRYRVSDHVITYCNQAWADQYRTSPGEAVGRRLGEFLSDDEAAGLIAQLEVLGPDHVVVEDVAARQVAHHPARWLHWIDRYLQHPGGDEILSIGRDVTERHLAETQLARTEAGFRDLADKSADIVWRMLLEPTPHFDYISPVVERLLGHPASYFIEDFERVIELLDPASLDAIGQALRGERDLERFDFRIRRIDGTTMIGETRTTVLPGGLQGVTRDVTDIRQLQASVAELALRDPLTGLANRRLLDELLDADLARSEASGQPLAVAFLDLDNFKRINDVHGHGAGDLVLREIARRLLDVVGSGATVARVGGDEFVIVYEPTDSTTEMLVERLGTSLSEPIDLAPGVTVICPASIGVAFTADIGYQRSAVLAAADQDMYRHKRIRTVRAGP